MYITIIYIDGRCPFTGHARAYSAALVIFSSPGYFLFDAAFSNTRAQADSRLLSFLVGTMLSLSKKAVQPVASCGYGNERKQHQLERYPLKTGNNSAHSKPITFWSLDRYSIAEYGKFPILGCNVSGSDQPNQASFNRGSDGEKR
jgi:hypothetical protein